MNVDQIVEQAIQGDGGKRSVRQAIRWAMQQAYLAGAESALNALNWPCFVLSEAPVQPELDDTPLNGAPPQKKWVGLTDQEIDDLWNQHERRFDYYLYSCDVEDKLREKNCG